MSLLPEKHQSDAHNEIGMLPMINIIFLLLVFFMIAGQVDRFSGLLNPASLSEGVPKESSLEIALYKNGTQWVNGVALETTLDEHLEGLVIPPGSTIVTRVDRALPANVLDPIISRFRSVNDVRLQIITVATK